MKNNLPQENITHEGIVIGRAAEAGKYRVKIECKPACAGCAAKNFCSAADMAEKIIEVTAARELAQGEKITILMAERLGWVAIFYAFFLPFLVMIVLLFGVLALGGSEIAAALAGLLSLPPYYYILYLNRGKIEKDFIFRAV